MEALVDVLHRVARATVTISAEIPAEHRSASVLGTSRSGTGCVIDDAGLVLTVNYVVLGATGLSVVDSQYVFVRGLGERYSNTTLAGSVLPTTEPDKKVVPLDLFPAVLLDSVQVAKSYSPDKSAEFAGGLVQVNPIKLPNRPVLDFGS